MNFVKFRFTFNEGSRLLDDLEQTVESLRLLVGDDATYYTWGIENLNKFGEITHSHLHLHYSTELKIATIRKRFQRWLATEQGQEWSGGRTGNVLYSLSEEKDVQDIKRFFRYPLKQVVQPELINVSRMKFPSFFEIKEQTMLAYEEWTRHVDINRRKREELLHPVTRDKIFEFLDNLYKDKPIPTKTEILVSLMKFYADEERSANKQTIIGYCQTAMWRYGVESFDDTARRWTSEF